MIKAVFFDIDGTLVSFKTHVVPKSTLHAIELLKKKLSDYNHQIQTQ